MKSAAPLPDCLGAGITGARGGLYSSSSNFWMPAANQFKFAALRISSTGVAQAAGGAGDTASLILKSPSAERGTACVLRSTNGGTFSQISVAKTLRVAVPPVGVTTSAVPMV